MMFAEVLEEHRLQQSPLVRYRPIYLDERSEALKRLRFLDLRDWVDTHDFREYIGAFHTAGLELGLAHIAVLIAMAHNSYRIDVNS